jgi:CBS-domain-containing membrane protein
VQAIDIMTPGVVTAAPDTSIDELIRLMLSHRISALPIVEGDKVIGIVSEGDLIRRAELHTEAPPSRLLELISSSAHLAAQYVRVHGKKAGEVMTPNVVTVTESASLGEIAALLESHHIKRVPVLRDGKLVGIVSRANLLRALASRLSQPASLDDRRIRDAVLTELRRHPWGGAPSESSVMVEDGVVHLWGFVDSEDERKARIVAAESTPGVRAVEDHLEYWRAPDPLNRPNWPRPVPP